jgi:hypothetical protein
VKVNHENNRPIALEILNGYVWITVRDGRILAAPLNWYDWLERATHEQRSNFQLGSFSVLWPELEDGIDMEALLVGAPQPNT